MALRGGGQLAVQKAVDNARQNELVSRRAEAEQAFEEIEGQKKAASGEAGEYRAVKPQNVELPTVPNIDLSTEGLGAAGKSGNSLRNDAINRARDRLGLSENPAAYIPASNVTRNGDEYVLKITKASLNKMLSPADGGPIPVESIVVMDNLERIANNGVWFESQGDRENRQQIQGFDHLKTTVYIDGVPHEVDMRVRLVQEKPGAQQDNVLYYFTPEELLTIKKVDTASPTGERRALTVSSENRSTSKATVPQAKPEVKAEDGSHTRVFSENMHVKQETPPHPSAAQTPSPQREGKRSAGVYDSRTDAGAAPLNRVLSDRAVLYLKAVSRATGLRINVVDASENADGWYENGEVFIAENCKDPVNWIAAHEVTHHLEQAAPEAYAAYLEKVKAILSREGDLQERITSVQEYYAERGTTLTEDGAMRELAANFTERLALDESLFDRIAREDRNLAQRLLDSLKEFIRKIRTTWSGQEIRNLEATRKAWEKALRESRGKTVEGGERQYLYAGQNAKTADKADEWFAGADRKQRFEIDDSGMKVKDVSYNFMTLEELIDHPALFEAYPDMRYMEVTFENLGGGLNGQYNRQFDSIAINHNLKNKLSEIRAVLIHEIQHAIQNREGFAKGSTLEAWERRVKNGFDPRREADRRKAREIEEKLAAIKKENPDFYREMMELDAMTPNVPRGEVDWDTLEKLEEDPVEWQRYDARREQLEEKYGDMEVWDFNDLLYERGKAAANQGRTAYELYRDTAGEIEARDAESRRDLTAEQRRNRKPYTGNEDTVFADGGESSYSADKYYKRKMQQWDGVDRGGYFRMGTVSDVLQSIGLPAQELLFDESKGQKAIETHKEITPEVLAEIPEMLENPIAVSYHGGQNVNVFGHLYDEEGRPIMVGVRIDCRARGPKITLVSKVRTVEIRNHDFANKINDDNVLYLNPNKKETTQWFQAVGESIPLGGTKFGLIKRIPLESGKINSKSSNRKNSLRGAREHEKNVAEAQKQGKRLEERAAFQRANVKNAAKPGAGELDRVAGGLLKDYSSQYDRKELTAQLERLYDRLAGGGLSGKALATEAEQVARRVLTEVSIMGEEGAQLRRELRQTKIHVPRELWADFEDVQKAKEIFAENPNIFLTFSQKQVKKSCILQGRVVDYQGIPHGSGFFVMCFPKEGWRKR